MYWDVYDGLSISSLALYILQSVRTSPRPHYIFQLIDHDYSEFSVCELV